MTNEAMKFGDPHAKTIPEKLTQCLVAYPKSKFPETQFEFSGA